MAEVATTKLLENDKVIVWEMVLEPGESTGVHTHEHSYIIQVIDGAVLEATDERGENPIEIDFQDGATHWVEKRGNALYAGDIEVPVTHNAKNIGETRYREILVEIK
jgi:anti-sigma factor ChrR (cupin superfamily)